MQWSSAIPCRFDHTFNVSAWFGAASLCLQVFDVDLSRFSYNSVRTTQISTDSLRSSQSSNCSFRAIQASNLEFVCPVLRQCVHSNHALVRIIPPRCNDRSLHWPTLSVLGNRAGVVILAVCGRLRRSHRSVVRSLRSPKEDFF